MMEAVRMEGGVTRVGGGTCSHVTVALNTACGAEAA